MADAGWAVEALGGQLPGVASMTEDAAYEAVRLAAAQGHALAQHELGLMHRAGKGVPRSEERCLELWRTAADGGLAAAQFDMGRCYAYGYLGVAVDEARAVGWYEMAARQGHSGAADELRWTPWRLRY